MEWRKILILIIVAPLIANIAWLLICAIFSIFYHLFSGVSEWTKSKYKNIKSWNKSELKNRIEILESEIKKLEEEKEWSNAIIDDYIAYTWIYPREISEKLEKRNKRKKRK